MDDYTIGVVLLASLTTRVIVGLVRDRLGVPSDLVPLAALCVAELLIMPATLYFGRPVVEAALYGVAVALGATGWYELQKGTLRKLGLGRAVSDETDV